MKTILCTAVSVDPTFEPFIVQVKDDDPAVAFCERWKASNDIPWVDHSNDKRPLRQMWERLEKLPVLQLPCQIDYVLYGWYD